MGSCTLRCRARLALGHGLCRSRSVRLLWPCKMWGMAGRGRARWRGVVALGGMLGLASMLAVTGATLRARDLTLAANVAQVMSVVLAVPAFAVRLVLWWRRSAAPVAVTAVLVSEVKEVLAGMVAEQWTVEAAVRSLEDPYPIPVQWRLTEQEEVLDHTAHLTPSHLEFAGSSDQIGELAARFRALDRRRLVILGGAGTGKTTLAVQLVLHLLASRQDDEPVPVLVSVAGWDPHVHPRLQDWLTVRLEQDYPALRATALGGNGPRTLVARSHVLAVLDGLDELPDPARARVIVALNRSLSRSDQLILTSRTDEFVGAVRTAADVITSSSVIEPQPLSVGVAAGYLRGCLPRRLTPRWQQILTALRTPESSPAAAALAEITATPLGLWLVRTVYIAAGTDPAPLLDPGCFSSAAALRAHLFDQLIPALIATRLPSDDPAEPFRPRRVWDPAQVRRWLGYLADLLNHMPTADDRTGTRDLAWWELARHCLRPHILPMTAWLTAGALAWLRVGRNALSWADESPGFADLHLAGRTSILTRLLIRNILGRRGVVSGLVTAVVTALVTTVVSDLQTGLTFGVLVGLAVGLVSGLMDGLIEWAETPTPEGRADTPMANWRADRTLNLTRSVAGGVAGAVVLALIVTIGTKVGFGLRLTLPPVPAIILALAIGLLFGVGLGLAVGLVYGLALAPVLAVPLGFAGGLTIGIGEGRHHAWVAYTVATYRLALKHRLPRRLMPFLDDAHRLGLLRAVGPIYQFRHAELQDHLAGAHHHGTRSP
jgi:NACHT domain